MVKQAYIKGFTTKCRQYGVDPVALAKIAATAEWQPLDNPDYTSPKYNLPVLEDQLVYGDLPSYIGISPENPSPLVKYLGDGLNWTNIVDQLRRIIPRLPRRLSRIRQHL